MAIVNHTGDISSNETWAAADEHHITGNVSFDGGSSGDPRVVTVEAGVTIYFDGNYFVGNCPANTDYGKIDFQGTEDDKITLQSDPTNFPIPGFSDYYGLFMGYHSKFEMDWVVIKHADAFLTLWNCANDTTDGGAVINNCSAQYCRNVFWDWPGAGAVDKTANNLIVVNGLFCKRIKEGFWCGIDSAFDMRGSNPFNNVAILVQHCIRNGAGGAPVGIDWNINNVNVASKVALEFTNLMISNVKGKFFPTTDMNAGEWLKFTITGLYADTNLFQYNDDWAAAPVEESRLGVVIRQDNTYRALMTVQDSVIVNVGGAAVDIRLLDTAGESVTVQRCDLIGCGKDGANYQSNNPTLILDNLYLAYNWGIEAIASGSDPQPTHYQWWDVTDAQAPTNVKATPVFPLDVENVAEGTPDEESITITFDSKEGSVTDKRLVGIPFIKYGTTSGSLDHVAGVVPWDKEERYKCFAKWISTYGAFAATSHSVAISNLKPGTTYYYTCCFIDPLGRIAEGSEGSFETDAAAGGSNVSNLSYGGIT